jgi:hypothetical protein
MPVTPNPAVAPARLVPSAALVSPSSQGASDAFSPGSPGSFVPLIDLLQYGFACLTLGCSVFRSADEGSVS